MRTWLIGEAPARSGDGSPFSGRSGDAMRRLLGKPLASMFELTNVFPDMQPAKVGSKGSAFDVRAAIPLAKTIVRTKLDPERDRIMLAGSRVGKAFCVRDSQDRFRWQTLWAGTHLSMETWLLGVEFCVVPHPSGVNRWWNDPTHRQEARRFLVHTAKEDGTWE